MFNNHHPAFLGFVVIGVILLCAVSASIDSVQTPPIAREFTLTRGAEAVATITASCQRCDWGVAGREGVVLRLDVDGAYSQHVLLSRGSRPAAYSVFLGPLAAGRHTLAVVRDTVRSARDAGPVQITGVDVRQIGPESPDHAWLVEAPILHARPKTIERFTDVPLAAYVEVLPARRGFRYTIVFSHEDGGTPTDRLMATWGRATDIEFVYETEPLRVGGARQEYQGPKHEILPFAGKRLGSHPLLWVSTDNNMVSDTGPPDAVRFALLPQLVSLSNVSREVFMDANPWLYAVMRAELMREARIDAAARAGSGKIPDPLRFGYVEACGDLQDATLAFDVGVMAGGQMTWHPTDRGDPRFRIARSGCFRAAVPLPAGTAPADIRGLRARAFTRPPRQKEAALPRGSGKATLTRVNTMFMLNEEFTPVHSGPKWEGSLAVPTDAAAMTIPVDK